MPLFTFINNINTDNNNQVIKELNMREINNKFKDIIKHVTTVFIKPLDFTFKK